MIGWLRKLLTPAPRAKECHTIFYRPGDVLVVLYPGILSTNAFKHIQAQLELAQAHLSGDSTSPYTVCLDAGMRLQVLRRIKQDGTTIVPFDMEGGTVVGGPPAPDDIVMVDLE